MATHDTLQPFMPHLLLALLGLGLGQAAQADDWVYTAREGDTLIGLANTYTQQADYWKGMQTLNHIADPKKIPPGTKIRIPVDWLKFAAASVRVQQVHGEAEILPAGGGASKPAQQGMELHSGDQIRTGADGTVSLEFADNSTLLVRSQSLLALDNLGLFRKGSLMDVRLKLNQGDVDSKITPAPAGISPRFRIVTPSAVAAVRGTDFRVGTGPADREGMRNETLGGKVEVGAAGETRSIPAGFGVVTEAGQAPQNPRKLLPAPDLAGLPTLVEDLHAAFNWPQTPEAAAYRAQIAPNPRFEALLADQRVSTAGTEFGALPDGDYVLRIRGIDAVGLEGFDATHAFKVDARPVAPYVVTPEEGGEEATGRPKFLWAIPEDAARYHLQLSSRDDFSALLQDLPSLSSNSWEAGQALPPGRYFWRVATIDTRGDHGPFSATHSFTVAKAP